jgi:hypothetical protein
MIKWLQDTYNGLYKILLEPVTPRRKMVAALVIGVLIGLLWAYVIQPVVFYNADPVSLHQSWQDEWVRMLADRRASANTNIDNEIILLLREVDDPVGVVNRLTTERPDLAPRLQAILPLAEAAQPTAAIAPQPNLIGDILPWIIAPIIAAILFVILTWLFNLFIYPNFIEPRLRAMRSGGKLEGSAGGAEVKQLIEDRKAAKEQVTTFTTPPLMQKISVYRSTYAQYDDSFSIEDEQEKFLGECGGSVSEKIGVGADQKATAIEVWLFDKDDFVRTMTTIFASEHAYNDPGLRAKLDPKGQVTLIKPGAVATLETQSLRLEARIKEVEYATGPLPPNSGIDKLTLELATWRKDAAGATAPQPSVTTTTISAPPPATPFPATPVAPAPVLPAPPQPTFTPQAAPAPMFPSAPLPPPAAPLGGGFTPMRPVQPPPMTPPPPARPPVDDDPFGGTGDFRPIR